jgi:hypothetical protein
MRQIVRGFTPEYITTLALPPVRNSPPAIVDSLNSPLSPQEHEFCIPIPSKCTMSHSQKKVIETRLNAEIINKEAKYLKPRI